MAVTLFRVTDFGMESPYAVSYESIILTYVLSRLVSKVLLIICQIFAVNREWVPLFNALILVEPLN